MNELLRQIAAGNESAFRELFHQTLPWLTPYVKRFVRTEEAVREVLQETFIRIWISRDKLPGLNEPRAWIYRVAANECFTWLHKQHSAGSPVDEESAGATGNNGEKQLEMRETLQLVHQAVGTLSPRRSEIYRMSRDEGLKIAEIAEQLRCSRSYVKNTLSEALAHIRAHLIAAGKIIPPSGN